MSRIMLFDREVSRRKPETIVHAEAECPFCRPETLTGIVETGAWDPDPEARFIFLRNKYNIMLGAEQFVLVESATCGIDMGEYSRGHMRALMRFALRQWARLESCGKYRAVMFFKNHGYLSGGTMRHPHMQLIGLADWDEPLSPPPEAWEGRELFARDGASVSAAANPKLGYSELNLVVPADQPDTLADFVQKAALFVTTHFAKSKGSYNLFFHRLDEGTIGVKVFARMPPSPLYIGYDIALVPRDFATLLAGYRAEFAQLFAQG